MEDRLRKATSPSQIHRRYCVREQILSLNRLANCRRLFMRIFLLSSGHDALTVRIRHPNARSSGVFSAPHLLHVLVMYSCARQHVLALALGLVMSVA